MRNPASSAKNPFLTAQSQNECNRHFHPGWKNSVFWWAAHSAALCSPQHTRQASGFFHAQIWRVFRVGNIDDAMTKAVPKKKSASPIATGDYSGLVSSVSELLDAARRASVRAVNAFMTATYWEIGRRIVEFEQGGLDRAKYGDAVVERLAQDLTTRLGRGFSRRNVFLMRAFYQGFPQPIVQTASALSSDTSQAIVQTLSAQSEPPAICSTVSAKSSPFALADLARAFPLPWSHYVLLISRSRSPDAFAFYHAEALRGGWSVRQLARQMDSQFYERTALSRNEAAMLAKGAKPQPGDAVSADEEIRHPLVLEFLGLRDEYSETDLEDSLIRHLETFLLELGNGFAFVGRQRRLRIDDEWYRVDLLFFHRRLAGGRRISNFGHYGIDRRGSRSRSLPALSAHEGACERENPDAVQRPGEPRVETRCVGLYSHCLLSNGGEELVRLRHGGRFGWQR